MNDSAPPPIGTGLCSTCFQTIDERARKCTACGSFQDWRRLFDFGTVVLAMLVALASVLSLAIPAATKAISQNRTQVEVAFQGTEGSIVHLLVTNTGGRDGSVVGVAIKIKTKSGNRYVNPTTGPRRDQPIIPGYPQPLPAPAGKSVPAYMVIEPERGVTVSENGDDCALTYTVLTFDNHANRVEMPLACAFLRPALEAARSEARGWDRPPPAARPTPNADEPAEGASTFY